MAEKRVFLYAEINIQTTIMTMTNLKLSDMTDDRPIIIEIQGHGGSEEFALSILERIHSLKNEVYIVCTGNCSSIHSLILACGAKKGNRYMHPNATISMHLFNDGDLEHISEIEDHTNKV